MSEPRTPLDIVLAQAEDEGLWFIAETAPEAYLQQELRRLHAAIEAEAALSSTEAGSPPSENVDGRLREALTQILLPAAWRPLADRPGAWITVLSTEHLARLRAALESEAEHE